MRTVAALTLYVSLTAAANAADWETMHGQARALYARGDYAGAFDLLRQSWQVAETQTQRAIAANDLGASLHQLGRDREARAWLERALDLARAPLPEMCDTLAVVDRTLGEYSDAERVLRGGLADARNQGAGRARLLIALGDLLREEGKATEARQLANEALQIAGLPWRYGFEAHLTLADIGRHTHEWQWSEAEWNTAADLARSHASPALEADALRGLGETWLDQGNNARAEPLLRRAVDMLSRAPDVNRTVYASALSCLARLYLSEDKLALAEESIRQALSEDEKVFGENHPQTAILLELLADTLARRGQAEEARGDFDRAWRIMAARFGEKSYEAGVVLATSATTEQRLGDAGKAVARFEKALAAIGDGPDLESLRLTVMERYADALKAAHRKREARAVLQQVKSFREP